MTKKDFSSPSPSPRPRVGISACLLGEAVRYDGGHRHQPALVARLRAAVDLQAWCPEAGAGLGVPRPPVQLVGDPRRPRALGVDDPRLDVTDALRDWLARHLAAMGALSGFVLKRNSPSCGVRDVPVFTAPGSPRHAGGSGLLVLALRARYPALPLADEVELADAAALDDFLEKVRRYHAAQRASV